MNMRGFIMRIEDCKAPCSICRLEKTRVNPVLLV